VPEVIKMGMVRINYEQMEQLRECSAKLQKPLSRLVAEAVNYWLAVVAPAKLDALRVTPLRPEFGGHSHQSLNLIEIGVETLRPNNSGTEEMMSGMSRFRVIWEIEIEATSPKEAARKHGSSS
jgi:hypothetical protein